MSTKGVEGVPGFGSLMTSNRLYIAVQAGVGGQRGGVRGLL